MTTSVEERDEPTLQELQSEERGEELVEIEDEELSPSGGLESSGYFPLWRPNRALRRLAARRQRKKAERAPVALKPTPIRIVLRTREDFSLAEELLALGAIQELKTQHNQLKIAYCTRSEEIYRLLRNRWFLSELHLVRSDQMFEEITGVDISLDMRKPTPEEVELAEKKKYDEAFEKETNEKKKQQEAAIEKGMKDFKATFPTYAFAPVWHLSNALLWSLAEDMGLPVKVSEKSIQPFGDLPPKLRRSTLYKLRKSGLLDKPFIVYDFAPEDNEIVLLSAIEPMFPDCQLISRALIEKALGSDTLLGLLSVYSHPHCIYVIGPSGLPLTAAWASGVYSILEFYNGTNPRWDGCQAPNGFFLNWSGVEEENKPRQLQGSVMYHLEGEND